MDILLIKCVIKNDVISLLPIRNLRHTPDPKQINSPSIVLQVIDLNPLTMADSGEKSKTSVMAPTPFPSALSTAIANNPRRFVATIAILTYLILATLTYRTVGDDKSAVPFVWFLVIPVSTSTPFTYTP
jgi:hypothetical protein